MDFFKSVFSDEPQDSHSQTNPTSCPKAKSQDPEPSTSFTYPKRDPTPKVSSIANAWTFGSSLIKTLASKSEFVIETYGRDLEEFGSGLRKETAEIRDVASRAVKDLPTSLKAGAAAAQESLVSVGQTIDNLGNTVTEIIAQGKESILAGDSDSDTSDTKQISSTQQNLITKLYSRLDSQIRAIQCDTNTYCEEPEDFDEYTEWKLGFVLDERDEEVKDLIDKNGVIEEIYNEIVPSAVDHETFWSRYFYRVYEVKKADEVKAKPVKKAILGEVDDELTWDVDDGDYEESNRSKLDVDSKGGTEERDSSTNNVEKTEVETEEKGLKKETEDKGGVSESRKDSGVDQKVTSEGSLNESESSGDKMGVKSDDKMTSEVKIDNGESCKDSDFSVVSIRPSSEEDDFGWDEIEDIGITDEIKVATIGSPNKAELRKRLSALEDDEDLTWDIEDDDEPVGS